MDILGINKSGWKFYFKGFGLSKFQRLDVDLSQRNLLILIDGFCRTCNLNFLIGEGKLEPVNLEAIRYIHKVKPYRNNLLLQNRDGHSCFGYITDHIF